jgi:hypothetical protein
LQILIEFQFEIQMQVVEAGVRGAVWGAPPRGVSGHAKGGHTPTGGAGAALHQDKGRARV